MIINARLITLSSLTLLAILQSAHAANYDATVEFTNKVTLSLPVTGTVKEANINAGQKINSGDTLITLEQIPFKAALQEAEANLLIKQSRLAESQRDLNHAQELYDMSSLSTVSLENAQQQHKRSNGEYNIAKARLVKAKYDFDNTKVIAPFNGWIIKVHTTKNETVNNLTKSTPLVTIAEAEKYTASTYVPLDKLKSLKIGSAATVSIENRDITAKISAIALEPKSNTSGNSPTYHLSISFHFASLLRTGQTVKVNIL